MDSNLIYAKTASGEEAMKKRTRVMQRNVRMVLILVDGKSTVADLCLKTGNPQLTEYALGELERGGFVEPRIVQDSFTTETAETAESTNLAYEILTAALDKSRQLSAPGSTTGAEPSVPDVALPTDLELQTPVTPDSDASISRPAVASFESLDVPVEQPEENYAAVVVPKGTEEISEIQPKSYEEPRPSIADRIQSFSQSVSPSSDDDVSIKPIRRGSGEPMRWPLKLFLGVVGTFALAFLTLFFFPYDSYLPEVENAFTQASGRPVKVGLMRVDFLPKPGLFLRDVHIGAGKDEIRVAEVQLRPAVGTLFASKIIFREVVLDGVELPVERLAGVPGVFEALAKPTARAGVERVGLENVHITYRGLGFSEMEGEATLSANGLFQFLSLRSPDRSLNLKATPMAQGFGVVLEGFGWRPSKGSHYLFDSINLTGAYKNGEFTISDMELYVFDGVVRGGALLRSETNPSIVGEVSFERINATRFGSALGIGEQFTGETAGKIRFSATADSWASIFSAIEANGEFTMHRGSVRGVDLAEAVRRVSKASVQGGLTLFESLTGRIKLSPTKYQFTGLVLKSGLMQSVGYIDVSKGLEISGMIELQMQGTVNQTRVPLSISGPLGTPIVKVGRS